MYPNPLLLMDEAAGRAEAARRGIPTTGTLGILRDAAADGLVDLGTAFAKLQATTFRLPMTVIADLLDQDARRRNAQ
jgi:predicted nucleic acid-binding protein